MSILNIFKGKKLKYNLGIVEDPRSIEEKDRDFSHDEIAGNVILEWKEKKPDEWKLYNSREQDGSLSCVGQSVAKAIEVMKGDIWSAHPIYRSRANYPEGGMWLQNAGDIAKKIGTTTEELSPSQWLGEANMNRPITVETPMKTAGYVMVKNPKNIDSIAEAIELYGQCLMIVRCDRKEWRSFIPASTNSTNIDFGHCVCGVDYFIKDGEKCILIEDSTGSNTSKKGQRIITESFLKKRFEGAMYFLPVVPEPPRPKHHFSQTLKYGMSNNEVVWLQECLKSIGKFPASVGATGNFFNITKKAVIDFQKDHGLVADGIVGPKTNAKLNVLFDQ